jgi:hypothetical protein
MSLNAALYDTLGGVRNVGAGCSDLSDFNAASYVSDTSLMLFQTNDCQVVDGTTFIVLFPTDTSVVDLGQWTGQANSAKLLGLG